MTDLSDTTTGELLALARRDGQNLGPLLEAYRSYLTMLARVQIDDRMKKNGCLRSGPGVLFGSAPTLRQLSRDNRSRISCLAAKNPGIERIGDYAAIQGSTAT